MIRWLWVWGPAIAQMAVIFILSSLSGVPSLPGGLTDYTGHVIGYALLGTLALRGFAQARWGGVNWASGRRAFALAVIYGITDEFHQMFVHMRTASLADWFADAIGAAIGVALVVWVARLRTRKRT